MAEGAPTRPADIADELLADKLVQMGHLNRSQSERLKLGRTKFNLMGYPIFDLLGQGAWGRSSRLNIP